MKTKVTELLQIEYPIIWGMAWVAEHHLAAAVSEGRRIWSDRCGKCTSGNCEGEEIRRQKN